MSIACYSIHYFIEWHTVILVSYLEFQMILLNFNEFFHN